MPWPVSLRWTSTVLRSGPGTISVPRLKSPGIDVGYDRREARANRRIRPSPQPIIILRPACVHAARPVREAQPSRSLSFALAQHDRSRVRAEVEHCPVGPVALVRPVDILKGLTHGLALDRVPNAGAKSSRCPFREADVLAIRAQRSPAAVRVVRIA